MKRIAFVVVLAASASSAAAFSACTSDDDAVAGGDSGTGGEVSSSSSSGSSGSSGSTGDGGGGPLCVQYAAAVCERVARCTPLLIDFAYGTVDVCKKGYEMICERMTTAPGA